MPLKATASVGISALLSVAQDLGSLEAKMSKSYGTDFANGVGAGQADKIFHDTRTIAASGTDDLDLAGVLLDPTGVAITFARIKALIISAAAANTNDLILGNAAATQWLGFFGAAAHTGRVKPGATFALLAGAGDAVGWTVAAGTGDLFRVTNGAGGTSVTYDVVILGASA